MRRGALWRSLYGQVLVAIALGIALGIFFPHFAQQLKPLGDGFIKLIRLLIAPIIFCTVVTGIAGMAKLKEVGKAGGLALLYFEACRAVDESQLHSALGSARRSQLPSPSAP
jgi:aerobic C4-dicarboxylate transport protein